MNGTHLPEASRIESKLLKERVISFDQACEKSRLYRSEGKKVVFTSGVFDILHTAHLHYLMYLKLKGDVLIVGIDTDTSVRRLKGEDHPFFNETERAIMVANIRCVDFVFIFGGLWRAEDIVRLQPSGVGIPSFDPNIENKLEKLQAIRVPPIITPPYLRSHSSSRKARLLQNDYLVTSVVVEPYHD